VTTFKIGLADDFRVTCHRAERKPSAASAGGGWETFQTNWESQKDEIALILPVPPSANRYWATNRKGVVYETDEAKAYKQEVALMTRHVRPLPGELCINFTVFRPRKCGDLDNYEKIMFDALQGIAYENDNQIVEIHSFREDDKDNPRVEFLVYE